MTSLEELDDLPLARASVRQQFLRRSRRWRDQLQEAGGRLEDRLEGWLEEPAWEEPGPAAERFPRDAEDPLDDWPEEEGRGEPPPRGHRRPPSDPLDDPWDLP
jgi:hypothetical protein